MKKLYLFASMTLIVFNLHSQVYLAGNALQYNGTSCLNFGNTNFNFQNQLSIMLWVRWDTTPSLGNPWANVASINSNTSSDDGVFWIQHNSNNSKFEFALTTINASGAKIRSMIFSNTIPQQGVWYHIAGTYDGTKMYLYINGSLEASTNKTGLVNNMVSNYYFTLGAWAQSNNNYRKFDGTIDELSIWNVALTSSQIQSYHNHLLKGTENGLISYYRFDESSGTTAYDLGSAGFNGQNTGCASATAAMQIASTAPIFSALPVSLLDFQPSCGSDSNVVLRWATATEINNDYFTLFRSFDGSSWEIAGMVDGSGNSNQVVYYEFTDRYPAEETIFYKLRQTDFDGKMEDFELVSVYCKGNHKQFSVFPNPVVNELTVSFNNKSEMPGNFMVDFYNIQGQLVKSYQQEGVNDNNVANIDLGNLPSGTYFMQARLGKITLHTAEILKK